MEIFYSKDYERFSTINGNRIINKKKVERLIEDIQNGLNLLPYCPIIVYEDEDKLRIVMASTGLPLPRNWVSCLLCDLRKAGPAEDRPDEQP